MARELRLQAFFPIEPLSRPCQRQRSASSRTGCWPTQLAFVEWRRGHILDNQADVIVMPAGHWRSAGLVSSDHFSSQVGDVGLIALLKCTRFRRCSDSKGLGYQAMDRTVPTFFLTSWVRFQGRLKQRFFALAALIEPNPEVPIKPVSTNVNSDSRGFQHYKDDTQYSGHIQ